MIPGAFPAGCNGPKGMPGAAFGRGRLGKPAHFRAYSLTQLRLVGVILLRHE
jgi:hypothetical protein